MIQNNKVEKDKLTPKDYLNKVLAGTATGIVVGLIPNAILGSIFKGLIDVSPIFATLYNAVNIMQFIVPVIVGVLVGLQFNLNPMQSVIVGSAVFLGSGAYKVTEHGVQMVGIGDLINIMLVACIAVYVVRLIGNKLGSLTILLLPIVGAGVGVVGILMLPYVKQITITIGNLINNFAVLQPFLMCILISISFSILIISPISTVAIGIAIGITGLGAGAAAIGVTACTAVLVIGSRKVNESGVTLSVLLGAMKMMMPNLVTYPIIAVPIIANGILSGIGAYLFNILGTPNSAGFGLVGLVGPLAAINNSGSIVGVLMAFVVIPFVGAFVIDWFCRKVIHLYDENIFKYI
ncbi:MULTISPECIES: PTS sugar transporter subunit IIC [unclassified Clostridium]|uniref:PTS sugar transporter subunit IIC n=1 Tax=unclassified Clostridium TaxID=2614128 RepID=UPI0002E7F706|nr:MULTISPECIES: PTS sugar transporter subunit IIC [unclassified Clostridium]MBN1044760.1 PTS sugar transporter subunit IIC [Clostridium botulinum]MBN1051491.1 PTS sugar transporter subunit IIC [Clostridium botulinum]MBN1054718.1 PTS sugar transporter subunit IIC [Clostridium botulinum]MBN1067364.1 PTS sugar transporter subunit IIC [Clostridium botulinum]NFS27524.1 PTS sugar transporter subunit IIC [Clostridium botulinum]